MVPRRTHFYSTVARRPGQSAPGGTTQQDTASGRILTGLQAVAATPCVASETRLPPNVTTALRDSHMTRSRRDFLKASAAVAAGTMAATKSLSATPGLITRVIDLQVQFHDFVPDAQRRMHAIQQQLGRTHSLTYQSEFVWENWHRHS